MIRTTKAYHDGSHTTVSFVEGKEILERKFTGHIAIEDKEGLSIGEMLASQG